MAELDLLIRNIFAEKHIKSKTENQELQHVGEVLY